MQRRVWLLAGAAACALNGAAWAQAGRRVIAVLNGASPDDNMRRDLVEPLRQGLADHGLVDGRDVELHFRWAEGRPERLPALLDELLRLQPALLVTAGPRPTMVARDANPNVPMVAVAVDDPVQMGIAQSPARPGGRFTGVSAAFEGILARRLQLLADLVPTTPRRFAVLTNPTTIDTAVLREVLRQLEPMLGPVQLLQASAPADFDAVFNTLAEQRVNGLVVVADATFYAHRFDLGARCRALKLPSVWGHRGYLDNGGLASYQGDFAALYRRSAAMIDKILKGTPPGDIPFEQGTKFELVVNLRAAQSLGLSIPPRVRVSADAMIE